MLGILLTLYVIKFNPHNISNKVFTGNILMVLMEKLSHRFIRQLAKGCWAMQSLSLKKWGPAILHTCPWLCVPCPRTPSSFPALAPPADLSSSCTCTLIVLLHKHTLPRVFSWNFTHFWETLIPGLLILASLPTELVHSCLMKCSWSFHLHCQPLTHRMDSQPIPHDHCCPSGPTLFAAFWHYRWQQDMEWNLSLIPLVFIREFQVEFTYNVIGVTSNKSRLIIWHYESTMAKPAISIFNLSVFSNL